MLKTIARVVVAALVVGIGIVLAVAATKPDTFRVQRSATIKAPPEKIFPLINDFRSWAEWSPYEQKDPAMKRTYGSATSGKGAVYGPGTATRMSARAAWRSPTRRRRPRS